MQNSHIVKINARIFEHAENSFRIKAIGLPAKAS
jgi:hypothetical protein